MARCCSLAIRIGVVGARERAPASASSSAGWRSWPRPGCRTSALGLGAHRHRHHGEERLSRELLVVDEPAAQRTGADGHDDVVHVTGRVLHRFTSSSDSVANTQRRWALTLRLNDVLGAARAGAESTSRQGWSAASPKSRPTRGRRPGRGDRTRSHPSAGREPPALELSCHVGFELEQLHGLEDEGERTAREALSFARHRSARHGVPGGRGRVGFDVEQEPLELGSRHTVDGRVVDL